MSDILFDYLSKFTTLSKQEQQGIIDRLLIASYAKGTVLLEQGDVLEKCYFVLHGCVRQFSLNEYGKEVTSNFYTEGQAIAVFNDYEVDKRSKYTFVCSEDCTMVVGELNNLDEMYRRFDQLESMIRKMVEMSFGQMQEDFAQFIGATPEERYKALLAKRPDLIQRVPQHQLASYLGITAESLSRIKKRIKL